FFALLQQGLEFLKQLAEQEQFLSLAFNLESDQLGHGLLLPRLCDSLQSHAIAACRLTFEITECGLLEVSPAVLDTLIRLRMMGAGLSI
ncbi:EAL domain-containing protein, partial [Pseudomonas sp. HY13-MNA-CIBAN-0226]|uniref:EAL domain-containing protein n=1 Tax=Pseudomonas sp. HY13-MNA-CIBAN-0226 TaxID=3140473 RepID=UPI003320AAD6